MSTALALAPNNVPDFLRTPEFAAAAAKFNADVGGGIKVGGFPRLSLKGGKFFIVDSSAENKRQLITQETPQGPLPMMALDVVIVGGNPGVSKVYFQKKWEEGDDSEPDCSSDNGISPDAHIATPQSNACATCPMNQWGSKITEQGKEAKACADNKRIAVIPVADLTYKALGLQIPPASLKEFGTFVRSLDRAGLQIPIFGVVCRITFDPTTSYPKLNFAYARFLTSEEFNKVAERMKGDDVAAIVQPIRAAAPAPALPAPTAPALQAPAAPAPAPAQPAATFAPPAPAPVAPPPPPPPPPPPAPVAPQYPDHVVAAVNAAGGFDSPVGQAVLAAMVGQGTVAPTNIAPAPAEPVKPRRPRAPKPEAPAASVGFGAPAAPAPAQPATTFAPPAPAPVAPPPPPAPAAPPPVTPEFAAAPAANVGQANDLTSQLAAIFGSK